MDPAKKEEPLERQWQGQWWLWQCGLCREVSAGLPGGDHLLGPQSTRGVKTSLEQYEIEKMNFVELKENTVFTHSFILSFNLSFE